MEAKMDVQDVEGQFARPDIFAQNGVTARMDSKFPFHPLERSEAKFHKNIEMAEFETLRRSMGMAMPMKLAMERKVSYLSCNIDLHH